MEKSPAENIRDKSLKHLYMLEKKGQYLFYGSPIKIENNFLPESEALFKNVDQAISSIGQTKEKMYIYVFSKEDLSKPVLFLEM